MSWVDKEGAKLLSERVYIRVQTSIRLSNKVSDEEDSDGEDEVEMFSSSSDIANIIKDSKSSPAGKPRTEAITKLKEATREAGQQYKEEQIRLIKIQQEQQQKRKHGLEVIEVCWKSRSKQLYKSRFLSCCGILEMDAKLRPVCGRSKWSNPDLSHPGTLTIDCSSRVGGCQGPKGSCVDHIPKPREPVWTCCWRSATSEGCKKVSIMSQASKVSQEGKRPQRSLFDDDLFS